MLCIFFSFEKGKDRASEEIYNAKYETIILINFHTFLQNMEKSYKDRNTKFTSIEID